jgi:hypothetical protein
VTGRFVGTVSEEGRLELANRAGFRALLKHLAGKAVVLTLGKRTKRRSDEENRYYWGVVVKIIGDELGYDQDEMHAALKFKFLRREAEPDGLRVLDTVRSTAKLTTVEFEDYLDRIRMWAVSEMGIVVPLPNEEVGV